MPSSHAASQRKSDPGRNQHAEQQSREVKKAQVSDKLPELLDQTSLKSTLSLGSSLQYNKCSYSFLKFLQPRVFITKRIVQIQCSGNMHLDSGGMRTKLKGGIPIPCGHHHFLGCRKQSVKEKIKGQWLGGGSEGGDIVMLCTFSAQKDCSF